MKRGTVTLLLVGLMVSSGCIGFLTGEKALTFTAGQATVSQQALSDTGYSKTRATDPVVTRNFSGRQVKVTNHLVEYKRQVSVLGLNQELARFTVMATPKVQIVDGGPVFNPVAKLSNQELAEQFQQKYKSVENVELVGNRSVPVLGENVRVSKFSARATTVSGQQMEVYLHIAQAETENDFVIAVAVYPQKLTGEQERINTLLKGIQHSPPEN